MKTIKVGIVATGMMGAAHTDALHRIPGVKVLGIANPRTENIQEVAESLGIPHGYRDYKKMCEELQLDVLHNCTPNSEHYEINKYAITHGIGIFSEKPLAVTVEEAEELCELAEKYKVPNGVNFNYRSNAVPREIRARMRNGMAGKPLLVHGTYLQDWLMYENDYNWRLDPGRGGKSRALADIGSHWFDTVQMVTEQKIKRVYAKLLTVYPERLKPTGDVRSFSKANENETYEKVSINSEDAGMIMVEFENGVYGNLILSQVSGGYKNGFTLSFDCSKCSLRWDQEEPDHMTIGTREYGVTKFYAGTGSMTDDAEFYATTPGGHAAGWAEGVRNNFRLFYNAMKDGSYLNEKQEYATFKDAAYIMKIVDACLKSSEEEKWVEV